MLGRSRFRDRGRGSGVGGSNLLNQATLYLGGVQPFHWLDFINNRALYAGADVGNVTQATGYSFTRASEGYYTNSDGTLTNFASGALRRGDRGVLIEGARTNQILHSQDLSNAVWAANNTGGTGVAPTVTANAGVAPDGTMTATRVQYSLGGGTTTADISRRRQIITPSAGVTQTSFYVRSTDGVSTYEMRGEDANGIGILVSVTGAWQRVVASSTPAASPIGFGLGLRGGQTPTNSNTADVLIWGFQVELGGFVSSYIPTVAAASTRAADVLTYTAGVSYPLSLWAEFERSADTGGTELVMVVDDGDLSDYASLTVDETDRLNSVMVRASSSQGGSAVTGSLAALTVYKGAVRFNTNSIMAARGGTLGLEDTVATLAATPTTIRLGAYAGGINYSFQYLRRIAIFNSALTDAQLQTVST